VIGVAKVSDIMSDTYSLTTIGQELGMRSLLKSRTAVLVLAVTWSAGAAVAPTRAWAVDTLTSKDAPDLKAVRTKIDAKDYTGALADLKVLADTVQHADIYNLMGFSLRKSGDLGSAATYYKKALEFDGNHLGALEYQGELFLMTGDFAAAKQNLSRLQSLCPTGCEERDDLAKSISTIEIRRAGGGK
jgi:Flp pilus assembly protein TadD